MQEIQRMTSRQRQQQQTGRYRKLIGIAEEVIESARTALRQTRKARGDGMIGRTGNRRDAQEIEHFCDLGARCGQSVGPPRARWRASFDCREALFDLRAPYRPDQARQGADADRVSHKVFLAESARA